MEASHAVQRVLVASLRGAGLWDVQGSWGVHQMREVPIQEQDLRGAVVMGACVTQLMISVEELRQVIVSTNKLLDEQVQILKAFSDLYIELTDETAERKWIRDRIERAERERARLRLPIWFWRPEEGKRLQAALVIRANWLHEEGYLEDDIFDLLQEYVEHLGRARLPDKQIASIVKFTRKSARAHVAGGESSDADAEG
jgi:hypothetical protein